MTEALRIGIAGLGTVGAGVVKILAARADHLAAACGRPIELVAVSARDKKKDRGIDLGGVLKIPLSTARRSLATGRLSLGVGGSTLAMHLLRVIYKTPPHPHADALTKLLPKFGELLLAPLLPRDLPRDCRTPSPTHTSAQPLSPP